MSQRLEFFSHAYAAPGTGNEFFLSIALISYLIKAVKVPLARLLLDHSGLLQEVIQNYSSHRVCFVVKLNVHEFSEST